MITGLLLLFFAIITAPQLDTSVAARIAAGPKPNNNVCTTAGCVQAANSFLSMMDRSADPCENFYQYACGKFIEENPIPDDKSNYGTFSATGDKLRTAMRTLLQNDKIKLKIDSKATNFTRKFYQQCANTSRLAKIGSTPLLDTIKSLGGWPLLNADWTLPSNFSLAKLLAAFYTESLTVDPFWNLAVSVDVKNVTRYIIDIDDALIALPREYFLNATRYQNYLDAYEKYIHAVINQLSNDAGLTLRAEVVEADVKEMLKFEATIAKYKTAPEDRRNQSLFYNIRTLRQLKKDVPNFDWQNYLSTIMPDNVDEAVLTDDLVFNIETLAFMSNVSLLLKKTKQRTLINYAMWYLVKHAVGFLDERYRDINQDFLRVKSGQELKSPRWRMCVQLTTDTMPIAAGALYVDNHFGEDDKLAVDKMVQNLMASLHDIISESDWMDGATKAAALNKLKFILPHLGYQEMAKNATALDAYYKDLNYAATKELFQSAVSAGKWSSDKAFRKLLEVVDRNRFEDTAAVVNAYYSPEQNVITFPAGILQPPFFDGAYPNFVNYGGMGAVIGHELTHAFDDQGSQYDEIGQLKNWWSNSSIAKFKNKTECIVKQFNAYEVPDIQLHVNGKLTQGENIADSGGVKEAYRAYRTYIEKIGQEEERLPGLDLTNDQILFLSFAATWCGSTRPDKARELVYTDPHSPQMFRPIGAFSNLPEFATHFKCKPGSQMNPTKRCGVW